LAEHILSKLDAAHRALYSRHDRNAARAALAGIAPGDLDHPDDLCDLGDLWWKLKDDDRAAGAYARAVAIDDRCADGHFGLGLVAEARGDRDRMIGHWLRTLELDAAAPPPPVHVSEEAFHAIADRAYAELPPRALELLENVAVLIAWLPDRHIVEDGFDPRLLGLITGGDLSRDERTQWSPVGPDVIQLFQRNIERGVRDHAELAHEIRVTVLHETAHFFGLDDDQLHDIGLA
jgi:predicted Zn-dependent protease with MMP-like domain